MAIRGQGNLAVQLPVEQQIPRPLWQLAAAHRLGSPQVVYTARGASSRLPGFFALLIGSLLAALFLYLYLSTDLLSSWLWWQLVLAVLIIAAWLLAGIWIILASLLARKFSVVVCAHGLIYGRRKRRIIRWEQIAEFWKDIQFAGQTPVAHTYRLNLLDGTTCMFDDALPNVAELGATVENEVIHHLFPIATTVYLAAKAVSFEAITISQWGISVQRGPQDWQTLPWALLRAVYLDESALNLYKIGEFSPWISAPVAALPNVAVLKRLIEQALLDHDPAALSEVIVQYASGLPVFFGDLSLSLQGIAIPHADRFITWRELIAIEVGGAGVTLTRGGKSAGRYTIPLVLIARASLLKDFITYLRAR